LQAAPVLASVPELEMEPAVPMDFSGITEEANGFSVEVRAPEEELSESEIENKLKEFGEYDPTLDLSSYVPPTLDLLAEHSTGELTVTKEELEENKNKIVTTLNNYNIGIEKIKATIGPTVTLYEIVPQAGVRISKIKNLEDDIALSLAALGIRIIAPIPGKGTIGIEVPNSNPQVVSMRAVVASEKFQNSKYDLPIVLGKTISNETFVTDLAKMPHLLMAGATGQGKSVGLNAILVSLLYKKHPSQIKFVLVDPKKVELTLFNKIERHFLAKLPGEGEAIITDTKKVVATLNSLCIEMDERYELLKDAEVRNIKEYNAKFVSRRLNPENGHRFLPYIVLVVDEFADLIMTAGREVETPIARLAQLARAIGIHLIIATQRPSVNIITGTIKANFPARIAFRVTSKIDSRTILDSGGADQLIGRGDMLLSTGNDLIRIQCAFVDTPEVEAITAFIGNQRGYPDALLLPDVPTEDNELGSVDDGDRDSMFEDAARVVVQTQQGSTSLIQRKLKLGYNRAGRIVDQLEAAGILGGFEGSKARKVL
ncbi:MAG: DNA translocase FtsK, partial [Flavobacteriales bacterium]